MTTIYLLDALFLTIAGLAAIFAFGVATPRFTKPFRLIFLLCLGLFLFNVMLSLFQPGGEVRQASEPQQLAPGGDTGSAEQGKN